MNTQERKLINKSFDVLQRMGNREMRNPVTELFEMEKKDEKQHRGSDAARFHCTVTEAAKYFTIKHVMDAICGARHDVKDILWTRLACYYGEAIAAKYEKEIRESFDEIEIGLIMDLDYCSIIEKGY